MADSESGSPGSYLSFICLSRLVSEIFACHRQMSRQTDNANHYYSWPPHCSGPAIKPFLQWACPNDDPVSKQVSTVHSIRLLYSTKIHEKKYSWNHSSRNMQHAKYMVHLIGLIHIIVH